MLFQLDFRYFNKEALIRYYFKKYFGERLIYIFVYGSRGYGEPRENSDFDLLVVLEDQDKIDHRVLQNIRFYTEGKYNMKVDCYFTSKKIWKIEWYNPLYLLGQAVISGRLIFSKYSETELNKFIQSCLSVEQT